MAYARVTALASVAVASALALMAPNVAGAGLPVLVGWTGVVALAIGVLAGEPAAVTLAAAAFVVRLTMLSVLTGLADPPVAVQVPLLVLTVELAVVSVSFRVRPTPVLTTSLRIAGSVVVATAVAQVLELAVIGTSGGGTLLRVAALITVVVLAGWMTVLWSRAVE